MLNYIEKLLETEKDPDVKKAAIDAIEGIARGEKIKDILAGSYGQGALSYAETFFRKKDALTVKDLNSLIEDLEDLNLLDKSGKRG